MSCPHGYSDQQLCSLCRRYNVQLQRHADPVNFKRRIDRAVKKQESLKERRARLLREGGY